jgi:hypothetical protein
MNQKATVKDGHGTYTVKPLNVNKNIVFQNINTMTEALMTEYKKEYGLNDPVEYKTLVERFLKIAEKLDKNVSDNYLQSKKKTKHIGRYGKEARNKGDRKQNK